MKQVTTITLTFTLSHKDYETGIASVRSLIDKLRQYDDEGNVELISNDDTDDYTFIRRDPGISRQFGFNDMDTFLKKYSKTGGYEIASVVRDYGTFISCESKTEDVEEEDTKQNL